MCLHIWRFTLVALLFFSTAYGKNPSVAPGTSSPLPSVSQPTSTGIGAMLDGEKLRADLAVVTSRLSSVETSIARSTERADQIAIRSSWFSLATVLGGALLAATASLGAQVLLMRHQRKINRNDGEAKVANTYVEWQLQQLSELYGPLRALLGQSNVLYRQMNKALVAADPSRFRFVDGADFDKQVFQILIEGEWVRFRTVKHLDEVYNKGYGVEPYFNDVVDVGARMADVIREKAGYARPGDAELVQVMGEYLAHYLVLKRLLDQAKIGERPHSNMADEQATFPIKIQELVDNGFNMINQEVMNWRNFKTMVV